MPDFTGVENRPKKQKTSFAIDQDSSVWVSELFALAMARNGRNDTQAMARQIREQTQTLEMQMNMLQLNSDSNRKDDGKKTMQQLCAESALERLLQKQKSEEVRKDVTPHQGSAKRPRSPPQEYIQQIIALNPVCLPCTQCY